MPVNIHGKEYYTVVERMNMLIKEHKGKYSLNTELVKFEGGCVIIKATLTIDKNTYTGIAMEEVGSSQINKFSALENCETSAIGRSLSSAGYFGSEFCSANELEGALDKQKSAAPKTKYTMKVDDNLNVNIKAVEDTFGKDNIAEVKNLISFGKHNGKEWSEVPDGYLDWVVKNCDGYKKEEAEKELSIRNKVDTVPARENKASQGMSDLHYEENEGLPL